MEERTDEIAREGGEEKDYRGGGDSDEEVSSGISQRMEKGKRGSNIRRIRKRVED